jgi:tetratricopeptide (TPR) repeat protein
VATTLNNLALLQKKLNQNQAALGNYEEALALRRALAKTNPRAYGIDYATTLVMGVYLFNQSKSNLQEAKEILQKFKEVPRAQSLLGWIDKFDKKNIDEIKSSSYKQSIDISKTEN